MSTQSIDELFQQLDDLGNQAEEQHQRLADLREQSDKASEELGAEVNRLAELAPTPSQLR